MNTKTSRNFPYRCHDEILPTEWQDYAEARFIPDDQIFRSWRRFKQVSAHPWRYDGWTKWIDRERVYSPKSFGNR